MRALRYATALAALVAIAAWNALIARLRRRDEPTADVDADAHPETADLIEHERTWYDYLRGFHAHHGSVDGEQPTGDHPEHGSLWAGLLRWQASGYLRGYTLGDDVYLAPNAPRVLRVHQAGHAPSFGAGFDPLRRERRDDDGLPDEPLRTLDVMLPGGFPHTLVRVRDPRGLRATYDEWLASGRIARQ